jgi:hypothetical protein
MQRSACPFGQRDLTIAAAFLAVLAWLSLGASTLIYEAPGSTGPSGAVAMGIVIDTDGAKVVSIRSGREAGLSYVEGCG